MNAITLTRQLVDIESISGHEAAVGNYLFGELCRIGYQTQRIPVEGSQIRK
jgi:putative aminopeptidase FrvX